MPEKYPRNTQEKFILEKFSSTSHLLYIYYTCIFIIHLINNILIRFKTHDGPFGPARHRKIVATSCDSCWRVNSRTAHH